MSQLSKRTMRMGASAVQAGVDTAVTIAARMPLLLSQGVDPTAEKTRETMRMVSEKVEAGYEGMAAAQFAWASFLVKAAFGGVRTASDVSLGLVEVAEAAMRPARRKVHANAKRLSAAAKLR